MPADCLVLRIIEHDNSQQGEDTDLYILYDSYHSVFLLRGKRSDTPRIASRPYSFESYSLDAVLGFVSFIIPSQHKCTFELYSYPNLPSNKDNITFDELRETRNQSNEVVAYINQGVAKKQLPKILSMLCEITNDYLPNYETQWDKATWDKLCNETAW